MSSRTSVFQDRPGFVAFAFAAFASAAALIAWGAGAGQWGQAEWGSIAWWALFCAAANMLPVPATPNIQLTMSNAVNLAIAVIFPPSIATALVCAAAVSEWEVKRETTFLHAAFNRAQLGLSTGLASAILRVTTDAVPPIGAVLLGAVAYQAANLLLVSVAERTSRGAPLAAVLGRVMSPWLPAGVSYLALGLLGYVFALTFQRVGPWAVALLMIPLLMARQALRVSKELEQVERDRRLLADRLIHERERERVRIASQMHDVVLQNLAALQLEADNVASAAERGEVEAASRIAGHIRAGFVQAISDLRGVIANLRRVSLDDGGLVPTLERYGRSFHAETGIEVHVSATGVDSSDIPLPVGLLLYECCLEAMTNVARHSGASKVRLGVARDGAGLELSIEDDGDGVDPQAAKQGLGLSLTRDKVSLAGGAFWVDSRKGAGTAVKVRMPVREP